MVLKDSTHGQGLVTGVLPLHDIPVLAEALANSLALKLMTDKEKISF
jgi:hypothetical protein